MICHKARHIEGFWNLATISFHAALSARGLAGAEFKSFVIIHFAAFDENSFYVSKAIYLSLIHI